MKLKAIRKMATFLLVLCVIPTLVAPACALEYTFDEGDGPNCGKPASVEAVPSLDKAGTETKKNAERTNNAENVANKDQLPAMGCVGGLLLLIPVAFWCAAKNRKRRNYCT